MNENQIQMVAVNWRTDRFWLWFLVNVSLKGQSSFLRYYTNKLHRHTMNCWQWDKGTSYIEYFVYVSILHWFGVVSSIHSMLREINKDADQLYGYIMNFQHIIAHWVLQVRMDTQMANKIVSYLVNQNFILVTRPLWQKDHFGHL